MLVSNYAIGATGGHADDRPVPPNVMPPATPVEGTCNGPVECRAAVRYQIKYGADVIKFMPSGGVLSLADDVDAVQLTQEEMNAIVGEAHTLRRKVAAHCHGDAAAKMAIKAGADSLEHGTFLKDDTLREMKKKGVYLVPTLFAVAWLKEKIEKLPPRVQEKLKKAMAQDRTMFERAVKIGVPIAFGTDAAVEPHGLNAREFALMTEYGMKPEAALMAATSQGAKLLGVDGDTGSLSAGKLADIIAVKGNPLTDIRTTEHPLLVVKAGELVFKRD
jgi:imidazolonepropionase-like amidohydrolase